MKPTIGLINLGCAKNLVDAEVMLGILRKNGYNISLDEQMADVVLVNTCSFIKEAEKESVAEIVRIAESGKKLIITGCLAQKHKRELMEAVPEALAVVGTSDIDNICSIVESVTKEKKPVYCVSDLPEYTYNEAADRFQITVGSGCYVKIAEGCNYSCSYCIIPSLRGNYRSRSIESIVNEAGKLGKKGVSELILIAQDTTSYGKDIYGKPSLVELLEKLNDVEDISWIRIMYTYPSLISDKLIKAIASLEKVVKYIDVPLQHSHPEILKLMNRPAIDNSDLVKKLRDNIPDVAVRTAFITGFPGETEKHYEHLYNFINDQRFDKLGVFQYSREKNTASYGLKGQVPAKIKKARHKELMQLQQTISKEINESFVNKTIPVIIESLTSSGKIIGRSYRDAPEIDGLVYLETEKPVLPGDIINAKVIKSSEYDLFAVY